jgi:hypothetical protein
MRLFCRAGFSPVRALSWASAVLFCSFGAVYAQRVSPTLDARPFLLIGELDGPEERQFQFISDALILPGGEIVVADRQASDVRVFDQRGRFICRFGGQGSGPSEFRYIDGIAALGDTLVVVDPMLGKVAYFNVKGRLLQTRMQERPGASLVGVGKSSAVWWSWMAGRRPGPIAGVIADSVEFGISSGESFKKVAGTTTRWRFGRSPYPFSPVAVPVLYRDSLLVPNSANGTLSVIGVSGRISRVITVPVPETDATNAWRILEREVQRREDLRGRDLRKLPKVTALPRIGAVLVDTEDRIWVKVYDPAEDAHWLGGWAGGEGGEWLVLLANGQRLATINLPAKTTPLYIGRDVLVARHRDEWDVQRVALHRIGR